MRPSTNFNRICWFTVRQSKISHIQHQDTTVVDLHGQRGHHPTVQPTLPRLGTPYICRWNLKLEGVQPLRYYDDDDDDGFFLVLMKSQWNQNTQRMERVSRIKTSESSDKDTATRTGFLNLSGFQTSIRSSWWSLTRMTMTFWKHPKLQSGSRSHNNSSFTSLCSSFSCVKNTNRHFHISYFHLQNLSKKSPKKIIRLHLHY